ncbi:BglG family transcription antiterminator [Streptococcus suis]|nr:PTS transporter subunit EIIA [Streptococcus suis]
MNHRSKEILNLLIGRNQMSLKDLAEIYEVSERTIRNDSVALNDYLSNLGFGQIEIKHKQVQLNLSVDKDTLLQEINKFDVYEYKFNSEERSLICLLVMIASKAYVTIQHLSEKLLTSRSTIVNDLKGMRELAQKHEIEIVSKAKKGFKVQADETILRRFLYQVTGFEQFESLETVVYEEGYQSLIELSKLENGLVQSRDQLNLTEKEQAKLLSYLTVSAYRNAKNFPLENSMADKPISSGYQVLTEHLQSYPYLSELDIGFVEQSLTESQSKQNLQETINKESIRIQVAAMRFIGKISQDLAIDFKDDYIFYDHFSAHLLRMLRREDHHDRRPFFIDDVIQSNGKIKQAIFDHLEIIEKAIGRQARPIEIDYIIIHVYAAMERKKRKGSSLKVALLTQERATEIFFIESKLNQNFAFNLDIYSVDDQIQGNYDLVLTTFRLPNRQYLPITPFISDEDYILIANRIDKIIKEKENADFRLERDTALRLYDILSHQIDDLSELSPQSIKAWLHESLMACAQQSQTTDTTKRLSDFLSAERISLDVDVEDWQDTIYQAGNLLVEKGDITSEYLDIVIENILENGPYMVISSGFAFPHAQIGDYNKRTAMHLIRLKEPVYFEDESRDVPDDITTQPVRYVCLLSAVDTSEHSRAFFNLSNLLKNPAFKDALDACKTAEEMAELIIEHETQMEIGKI